MKQTYHSNSTTNVRLRSEINKRDLSNGVLASKFGVSKNTVKKWKKRAEFTDKSSQPHTISYALSELQMLIAVELRSLTWWVFG